LSADDGVNVAELEQPTSENDPHEPKSNCIRNELLQLLPWFNTLMIG